MSIREVYEQYVIKGDEVGIKNLIECLAQDEILLNKLLNMVERARLSVLNAQKN